MTQSELIHKVFYQDEFGAMLLKRWNESVLSNVPTDISSDKLVYSAGMNHFIAIINQSIAEVNSNE